MDIDNILKQRLNALKAKREKLSPGHIKLKKYIKGVCTGYCHPTTF